MPKYPIERKVPGAGNFSPTRLAEISQQSSSALKQLGPDIQWIQSYVTDDAIYCVYIAPNTEIIQEHSKCSGFLADRIIKA